MAASKINIGSPLLLLGAIATAASIYYASTPLAFIGLTLLFWGFLFLLVLKTRYVKPEVVTSMLISNMVSLENIIEYSKINGEAVYIPLQTNPYLSTLSGMKNEFVYLPLDKMNEEESVSEAFRKDPRGIRLTPPGSDLANLIEEKSGLSFQAIDLNSLQNVLEDTMIRDLELAGSVNVKITSNIVTVTVSQLAFQDPCKDKGKTQYICKHIGCPICSSMACIITRVTKKPVRILDCYSDAKKIQASLLIA